MSRRILVAGLLLLLAGCSTDPEPKIQADPTPTAAPVSTSPTVAAPETPEDFIRRWAKSEIDMQNSGLTSDYRAITARCDSCAELADQVEGYYSAGGYVRFEGQTVRRVKELGRNGQKLVVRVDIDALRTEYVRSRGAKVETFDGGKVVYKMTIEMSQAVWQLIEYTRLES